MRVNFRLHDNVLTTHEGANAAQHITAEQRLRRAVLSCFLWEDEFYEDGESIAERIKKLAAEVDWKVISQLAIDARSVYNLRHAPLYLAAVLANLASKKGNALVSETIAKVIQRADELPEFLAIYAKVNGAGPGKVKPVLSNQVRKGLAMAFGKFTEYQLQKYAAFEQGNAIKLRDVMFLCHPKAGDVPGRQSVWKAVANKLLEAADTWENALMKGADKKETFERLIREDHLGYLALLRNLRNMTQANVDSDLVREAILARKGARRVLPFRYVAAARAAPMYEPQLDAALQLCIDDLPLLHGTTAILVDVSGSMNNQLSKKSDMTRMTAAATLASIVRSEQLRVFSFSDGVAEVPARRGMAGVDVVINSQHHNSTQLFGAINLINRDVPHDRMIVISDEQAHYDALNNRIPNPACKHAYMINVASAQNGVGYGRWNHIDGFSENVIRWIYEYEKEDGTILSSDSNIGDNDSRE